MQQPSPTLRRGLRVAVLGTVLAVATSATTAAAGKPGYPDKVTWSGATWQVKTSRAAVGPGPNVFDKANVQVDGFGYLHLKIQKNASGTWTTSEIIGPTSFGYGTYTFVLGSRVDTLDPNAVLGLFTWSDKAPYAHRELDIEFARWGNAADPTNAQYVVQPWDGANHLARFTQPSATVSTQRFTWRAGSVSWQSLDASNIVIASYTYTGSDVPVPGDERVHLNFWLFNGAAPTNAQPAEVIVRSFSFAP
jgi:hypothetical protein